MSGGLLRHLLRAEIADMEQLSAERHIAEEELDVPRRNGPAAQTKESYEEPRNRGVGSSSAGRRDGWPHPASRMDESDLERSAARPVLGLILGGFCYIGIIAALWWLSRQSGDVIGRLVALGFVILGSVLIAYALARMERQ